MIEIQVDPQWGRWVAGFAGLGEALLRTGRAAWEAANEAFYDTTQDLAHVDTGDMKRSGARQVVQAGEDLVAEVSYDEVPTIFEEARGGDHAFLSNSWERCEPVFAEALPAAFELVVASWR